MNRCGLADEPAFVLEVLLVTLRRPAALLFGALIAAACRDPSPSTGTLIVSVTGLPAGAVGSVRVTGPGEFLQVIPTTITLENLVPGAYILRRDTVLFAGNRYGVAIVVDTVTIGGGRTESTAASYDLASGSLTINVSGLPAGTTAPALRVRGPLPNGLGTSEILAGAPVTGMRPGQYEIMADTATNAAGDRFVAVKLRDTVVIPASLTPVQATVAYGGNLALTVQGLPVGALQPVIVTGPGDFEVSTGQSLTLRGLVPGTYSVASANVGSSCPKVFSASNSASSLQQTVDVQAGATASVGTSYSEVTGQPDWVNLRIEKVYLTQASQNSSGSVPLISGKTALLRVFGVASQCNTVRPSVRVTLSTGLQVTIPAPEDSVRVEPLENSLGYSWNLVVPASDVRVGMTVVAEMDVTGAVAEANEADNRFPASGARTIAVRTAPVVGLRFVPIVQASSGAAGSINTALLLDWPLKLHPVGTYDVDVRQPITTQTTLRSCQDAATGESADGGCPSWAQVLSEVNAVRVGDGNSRYYYGVARVNYSSGVAGMAFVPGKTGIGWDFVSTNTDRNSGSQVMAHELGHNFNRHHAPCGSAGGADPRYPSSGLYVGGKIGVLGWHPAEGLKSQSLGDIMGYCRDQWISDYTYVGMLNWLLSAPSSLSLVSNAVQPSLMVWGRIDNGQLVLEPTFEISARPESPAPGPHRVTATDADGNELFAVSFAGERVADMKGEHEHFAFTVPVSALRGRPLAALTLSAGGKTVRTVASSDVAADPAVVMTSVSSNAVRLRWDATRFPVVMVRDPMDGQILSFARGGDATIVTGRSELEVNFSNRVRSSRRLTNFK